MTAKKFFISFFLLNLLLSTFFLDASMSANPMSRALPVLALFEHGTFQIDAYKDLTIDKSLINGHYYSDKPPLSSLIVLPFYGVLRLLVPDFAPPGGLKVFPIIVLGDILCGSIPFVLAMTLSLYSVFGARRENRRCRSVLVAIFSWYGSYLFVWSGVYFGHLLAGLFLMLSYIQLIDRRSLFMSGLFLGLAILTDYPSALALPVWLFYLLKTEEQVALGVKKLVQGLIPAGLLFFLFNSIILGGPFTIGYSYVVFPAFSAMRENFGFGWPSFEALYGILFGSYRGLFFFSPILAWLFFEFSIRSVRKKNLRSIVVHPLFGLTVVYLLMNSCYYMWWGGASYGPRLLIPITMLLTFEAVRHYDIQSRFFPELLTFGVFGTLLGFLAKTTYGYSLSEYSPDPLFQQILPRFMTGELSGNNVLSLFFGIRSDFAVWCWPLALLASLALTLVLCQSRTRPSPAA